MRTVFFKSRMRTAGFDALLTRGYPHIGLSRKPRSPIHTPDTTIPKLPEGAHREPTVRVRANQREEEESLEERGREGEKERKRAGSRGLPSGGEDEGWRRRDDGRRRPGDPRGDPDQLRSRAAGLPPMPPRQDLRPGTLLRRRLLSHMAAG